MSIKHRVFALTTLTALALTGNLFAARRAMPTDGAPFPANSYNCFHYENGTVVNACADTMHWDLTAHIDNTSTQNKNMTIRTNGNNSQGTVCWGVSVAANGSATLGSTETGQLPAWPANGATAMTTPSVSVSSSHTFLVTCALPFPVASGYSRIASYSYAP